MYSFPAVSVYLREVITTFLLSICVYSVNAAESLHFQYEETLPVAVELGLSAGNKNLKKVDVVLVGETVTIDQILKTNGGNVLILADRLRINAPIDTRVYTTPTRYWATTGHPSGVLTEMLQYGPAMLATFTNQYTWHEYYDSGSRMYRYRVGSFEDLIKGALEIPAMPSALVPHSHIGMPPWENVASNGGDPPANYDRAIFRSGNISIYARSIEFCDQCFRAHFVELRPPHGDLYDAERKRFLNAEGLKGGRGGLGAPFPCPHFSTVRLGPDCNANGTPDRLGGVAGNPGRGGDAGNIDVLIINNNTFAKDERQMQTLLDACTIESCANGLFSEKFGRSIAGLSSVAGGPPSHEVKPVTPSAKILASSQERLVDANTKPHQKAGPLHGKAGTLTIAELTPEAAMSAFGAALTALDLNPSYDLQTLFKQLSLSKSASSPLARDMLMKVLSEALTLRQAHLLHETPALLGSTSTSQRSNVHDWLSNLSCNYAVSGGLTDVESELVARLCDTQNRQSKDELRSFFYNTGGLLKPTSLNIAPNFQMSQALAEFQLANQALQRISGDLLQLNNFFYSTISDAKKDAYKNTIKDLEDSLTTLENEINKHDGHIFKRLLTISQQVSKDIRDGLTAWSSENYLAAGRKLGSAANQITKWFATLDGPLASQEEQEAANRLATQLDAVRTDFSRFLTESAEVKRELLARQATSVKDYLDARKRAERMRVAFLFDFENQLRSALILLLENPASNQSQFLSALRSQRDILLNFPNQALTALPQKANLNCSGDYAPPIETIPKRTVLRCTTITASKSRYVISTGASAMLPNFPLLVVGSGTVSFPVQFLGLFTKERLNIAVDSN